MPKRVHWTDEMDDIIRECVECGESQADAAREIGVCVLSLQKRCKALGIKWKEGHQYNRELEVRIITLIEAGCNNCVKLAARLGVNKRSPRYIVQRLIRDGLLRRVGHSKWSHLVVTKRWTDGYLDNEEEDAA